ncbi:MAG: hypothetical protein PVF58_09670 [Candidatus Methanofastidiosia archaeon]|jgi:hypothetical protein
MEVKDVINKKMAVLLLVAMFIVAGISPVFDIVTETFVQLLDSFHDEIPIHDGGGSGGGGGWPDGDGGG